jgi:hypothetical protein
VITCLFGPARMSRRHPCGVNPCRWATALNGRNGLVALGNDLRLVLSSSFGADASVNTSRRRDDPQLLLFGPSSLAARIDHLKPFDSRIVRTTGIRTVFNA